MKTRFRVVLLLLLLLAASGSAFGANVRGRIDFRGPAGIFPMANARVDFCWAVNACVTYFTGNDGMFYLQMNPGQYAVMVNGIYKGTVVIPDLPNYDLPPIFWN